MRERLMVSVGLLLCSLLLLVTPVAADDPIVGEIRVWTGNAGLPPDGWTVCGGAALSRTTYSQLFGVVGTKFGAGDGSTTFNVPDLKGRNIIGYNSGDASFDTVGETGGEKNHTLTIAEMPAHSHDVQVRTGSGSTTRVDFVTNSASSANQISNAAMSTGGGAAHNVLDPYMSLVFIIYHGVGLPTATPTPTPTSTPTGTITPTPTATATPGAGGSGPITGTITGSIIITQSLPANAFTTTMTTGNELVWYRSASYGEIIAGSGGVMGFVALLYVAVLHFSRRPTL